MTEYFELIKSLLEGNLDAIKKILEEIELKSKKNFTFKTKYYKTLKILKTIRF